jgi:V/A-type H+-transporting ATPase subunit I
MLKLTVLAHQSVMDDLVARMQCAGVLDVEGAPAELPAIELSRDSAQFRRLEEYLADATFVRDFLGRFHTSDRPFGAFVSEKIHMDAAEYEALEADAGSLQLYRECEDISAKTATLERERARSVALAGDLWPWEPLHLQISRWRGTEHVVLFAGIVPAAEGPSIRQSLREVADEVTVEELQSVGGKAAWVVMAHRAVLDDVRAALSLTSFQEVTFPGLSDTPAEERAIALARVEEIDEELAVLAEAARVLAAAHYHRAVALVEAIASDIDALEVRERFGTTERTFVVRGWVRESRREELEAALAPLGTEVDLTLEQPGVDDAPPVVLENPKLIRPFEVLTELYGLPRYDETDPTPLLAPFFLAFFAICISDVGYGLMLIAGAWYIKNRIDVAPGVKKFMDLLTFGGAGAMVAGVLFGSYFALDFDTVRRAVPALGALRVLDPLQQLPVFLLVTIALGVSQVFFGVLIAAYDAARRGDAASAFFDQISTLVLFGSIALAALVPSLSLVAIVLGLGVTVVFKGRALEAAIKAEGTPVWDRAMGLAWIALGVLSLAAWAFGLELPLGWVMLGVTVAGLAVSRATRRAIVAVLGGMYAVYGMTSFLGDILSYTRLAALGLSGALVGMVFNTLAGLVMESAGGLFEKGGGAIAGGVAVVLLASLVFVVGHVFNVVINLLGAFVHPARLQFVEFFSKFYEGGGRSYRPFAFRTKSLVLHAGGTRQEGAGS